MVLLRQHLERLSEVLAQNQEDHYARRLMHELRRQDNELASFLTSNDMWGGAGSIADEAGVNRGQEAVKSIYAALIALGEEQIRVGIVNRRTKMWVDTFRQWAE